MKDTIIKAIAIVVCVFLVSNSISTAIGKFADAETQIAAYEAEAKASADPSGGLGDGGLAGMIGGSSDSSGTAGTTGGTAGTTDGTAGTTDGTAGTTDGTAGTTDGGAAAAPAQLTKADVIKFFNEETAKAAKGSYELTRSGAYTKAINVGNATDTLNKIIKGVDKNADLNSVVGNFIGIRKDPIKATVKSGKAEGVDSKYMLKAMSLTDSDVIDFAVNGNKYAVQIANCKTPNASSPMAHATNDYITFAEVNKGISDSVGNAVQVVEGDSTANYTKLVFIATVADGKITNLEYSYTFSAKLALKLVVMTATGTGEAEIKGSYANIKY